jgi:peptide methionine sulfoxide reductase msrA/msrB
MEKNRLFTTQLIIVGVLMVLPLFWACSQKPNDVNYSKIKNMDISADTNKVVKTEEEWKKELTPDQYYILREKGTERPYTGKFLLTKDKGMYTCAACGNPLFSSDSKFDSHCGWPSFDKEVAAGKIITKDDNTLGMRRTEIMCGRCGGHLGHVFDDGPTETGLRYCVNSVSLEFVKDGDIAKNTNTTMENKSTDTLTLGAGCFWCVEAVYRMLDGVISAESGYSGGNTKNPTYKEVCNGTTGHAEVVQIVFDPKKTSVEEILKVFFTVHDPTTLNRQGADVGTQYRSAIYYRDENQKKIAEDIISALSKEHVYDSPIVTEVTKFDTFYIAEDYHQDYYNNNGSNSYCAMVVKPKVEKFEKVFKDRLKKNAAH